MAKKYQVFISFRGDDTRSKFTSYLHARLLEKHIETYIDYRLEKGDEISSALLRAIEESKIAVVIFSDKYADSRWCLDELVHILECREKQGMIVVPVFYEIDPSRVRNQSHSYEAALLGVADWFEVKKLQNWREALTVTADLAGFDSRHFRIESEFVDAIIEDIVKKLVCATSSSNEFKGIVGIDKNFEEFEKLLSIQSPERLMVGIWGMGGAGKTTLARVVFERLSSRFEGCCFLTNVREESGKHGLKKLQVKLVSELLDEDNITKVSSFHKERLRHKRVLIVLDDVDEFEHLEYLAGGDECFGIGSRTIVTTRNAEVLRNRAEEIYELKGLNCKDSLELFSLKAFQRTAPSAEDIELSKRVVKYVNGIPLALTVLGSFFRSKRRENWDHELDKLNEVPNNTIYSALKISYDGLDEMEQSIFLDIACFTQGHASRNSVNWVIGHSFVNSGIDSLVDKSLLSSEGNFLVMHDLVREMGQKIARQQSTEEPGKRSRIWNLKDVCHVLKNNTGTSKIEGISHGYFLNCELDLSPMIFSSMYNLRFLNPGSRVNFPQGLQNLPNTLTCLVWYYWPLKSFPTNFAPLNLVVLKMPSSKLEQLWHGVHNLSKLRYIDLSRSYNLTELPDLSRASNLEFLNLNCCKRLRRLPSCLRFRVADSLPLLSQCGRGCDSWQCWTVGYLNLRGCSALEVFPDISGSVKKLICTSSSIAQLPSSICYLNCLEYLCLTDCHSLRSLPSAMQNLRSLKYLEIRDCSSLDTLPALPTSIVELHLNQDTIEELPSYLFEGLSCLEKLYLSGCSKLLRLPSSIGKLKSLRSLILFFCEELKTFIELLEPVETLEVLDSTGSGIRELPTSIENLVGLKSLEMGYCTDLEILPLSMSKLSWLQTINLAGCSKLKHLPPLTVSLTIEDWSRGVTSEFPNGISLLNSLDLSESGIEGLPENINQLRNLITLRIRDCKNLKYIPELPLSLQYLVACGCGNLELLSNPRAVLAEGWRNKDYSLKPREFFYNDCFKLDKNTCNIIVTEFQMRSLLAAAISTSKHGKTEESRGYLHVNVCCPGKKIPEWFNAQVEAPSLHVTFSSHGHDDKLLGVAVCAVVKGFTPITDYIKTTNISCKISLKSNQDKICSSNWNFAPDTLKHYGHFGYQLFQERIKNSENMYMWYLHDDNLSWLDVAELRIEFHINGCGVVRSCGIRLLKLHDFEELGVAMDQRTPGNLKDNDDDRELKRRRN